MLVTGGTGALGSAVVGRLLADGHRVVSTWVEAPERDRLMEEIDDPAGALELIEADVSTTAGAAGAVEAARSGGPLGGLVCLVGGFRSGERLHEEPEGEFERMLDLNVLTVQRTCRAAIPALLGDGGSIVVVGAKAALEPFSGAAGYITSKAAVIALARAIATEYRDDGIRANAVLPSVIDTPANRRAMPDSDHDRWVPPAEIAAVISFLVSPASAPTSGAAIPVYGRA